MREVEEMNEVSFRGPITLVVEDDAVTRMATVVMLREAGYETVEATSGPRAMLELEDTAGIHLLLTDIDMSPGFDGVTLAACVHYRWPDVGIIMTSGKVKPVPGDVPSGAVFLAKPYAEARVLAAISDLLAQQDQLRVTRSIARPEA